MSARGQPAENRAATVSQVISATTEVGLIKADEKVGGSAIRPIPPVLGVTLFSDRAWIPVNRRISPFFAVIS